MSTKLEIAIALLLTLVPFWIAMVAVDLTRKGIAIGVVVLAGAAACFYFGGLQSALAMICAGYGLCVAWAVTKTIALRIRRSRLSPGSRPERADLERWARRSLRREGWTIELKTRPPLMIARRKGYAELHVFCLPSYEKIGPPDLRELTHYASRSKHPFVILLFGSAPAVFVETLRSRQLLPVSQRDFLGCTMLASSRDAFIKACRAVVIEDVSTGPRLFSHAEPSLA